MTDKEANQLRLVANEIMHKLWRAEQVDQLWILREYGQRAVDDIMSGESCKEEVISDS